VTIEEKQKISFWSKPFGKYIFNNAVAADRLLNAICFGSSKETCSSRLGRIKLANGGKIPARYIIPRILTPILNKIQEMHCENAIEWDEKDHIIEDSVQDANVWPLNKVSTTTITIKKEEEVKL
jgi:hypothetical protein